MTTTLTIEGAIELARQAGLLRPDLEPRVTDDTPWFRFAKLVAERPVPHPAPVAYQIRRLEGPGEDRWEICSKEWYDATRLTGRFAGWYGAVAAEARALVPAP